MNKKLSSEYGQIKIHKKVIAQIAETAAGEIKGVKYSGLLCYNKLTRFMGIFGFRGTKIVLPNELKSEVRVILPIVARWGENVIDIAYQVQKNVIFHMVNTLNTDTLRVDVKIKGIEK